MATGKVKTKIEPAVAAKLSYKADVTISATQVAITHESGRVILTRTEFNKLVQADEVFRGELEMGDGLTFKARDPIGQDDVVV
jgi:hypothetical protein